MPSVSEPPSFTAAHVLCAFPRYCSALTSFRLPPFPSNKKAYRSGRPFFVLELMGVPFSPQRRAASFQAAALTGAQHRVSLPALCGPRSLVSTPTFKKQKARQSEPFVFGADGSPLQPSASCLRFPSRLRSLPRTSCALFLATARRSLRFDSHLFPPTKKAYRSGRPLFVLELMGVEPTTC